MPWRRSGDKPLFEPMMVRLPTHICVTRPQWVNTSFIAQENPYKSLIFCLKKFNYDGEFPLYILWAVNALFIVWDDMDKWEFCLGKVLIFVENFPWMSYVLWKYISLHEKIYMRFYFIYLFIYSFIYLFFFFFWVVVVVVVVVVGGGGGYRALSLNVLFCIFSLIINSLWSSEVIWWQRSGSTLAYILACCLTVPRPYPNQCWLIINPWVSGGYSSQRASNAERLSDHWPWKLSPHVSLWQWLSNLLWYAITETSMRIPQNILPVNVGWREPLALLPLSRHIIDSFWEGFIVRSSAELCVVFNTLRPRQYGRHFPDDIFKFILLKENISISIYISLKFVPKGPINNPPALVQIMVWRRPGSKPLSIWTNDG